MKCFYTDKPSGAFFAVYSDFSAAFLFNETDSGKYEDIAGNDFEDEVDADWFIDAGYVWFVEVDKKFVKLAKMGVSR